MKLRSYQKRCVEDILHSFSEGKRRVMVQSPTGTGKSVIISEIVKLYSENGQSVLFAVDTKELVSQIYQTLYKNKIFAGVIMAGVLPMHGNPIQVASIQTLNRRNKPKADVIIIDEAHGATSESYRKLWDLYPEAKIIGFTATPYRLTGIGFSDLFETLIETGDIGDFIEEGYLVQIKHFACSLPDFSLVVEKNGDYEDESAVKAMQTAPIIDSYLKHCNGEKGIVFAQNVEHSKSIAEQYKIAGVPAVHIDSTTDEKVRVSAVKAFREGKIKVLCNVNIFIKGLDVPDISFVQLLRMTKSLTYYLQMVGRATRTLAGCASYENKEERLDAISKSDKPFCKVLDHAGLFSEHGFATSKRNWHYFFSRTKKTKVNKQKMFLAKDNKGNERVISNLEETLGFELFEVNEELFCKIEFDKIVSNCLRNNHKLISCYFQFTEYLKDNNLPLTESLFNYITEKLLDLNKDVKYMLQQFNPYFLHKKRLELYKQLEIEILI